MLAAKPHWQVPVWASTVMFTVSVDSIALMPCNPNVGGSSKGHLVRELDALGGEMGKNIDKTFIQSKMLNQSKGPAVHSLRAQADKQAYSTEMRKTSGKHRKPDHPSGRSNGTSGRRRTHHGRKNLFRSYLSCKSSRSLYRNLPQSPLHLRRCKQLYGTKRTSGSQLSH